MRQEEPSINPFRVTLVRWASGERMPTLLDRQAGVPLHAPMLYALMELRSRGRASATIDQALRAVMVLLLSLRRQGIDLEARIDAGKLLDLAEIEEVSRHCRLELDALLSLPAVQSPSAKVVPLKGDKRPKRGAALPEVGVGTVAIRMLYVRDYLEWFVNDRLQLQARAGGEAGNTQQAQAALQSTLQALAARTPSVASNRNTVGKREGLTDETKQRLEEVLDLDSPENPWKGAHARERNAVLVRWLRDTGMRRGEVLGLKVSDVNFQKLTVLVARNADAPEDPRVQQPLNKTADRVLPISAELATLTRKYVMGARRAVKAARKHEYLFVANGTGAPMSLSALNKLFTVLREKCPDLPDELSPHVLRHTWNDEFSEQADARGISGPEEERLRNYQMGWSPTSSMGSHYSKRHTRKKAREVSLGMQEGLKAAPQSKGPGSPA